jgi:hypothetical protein
LAMMKTRLSAWADEMASRRAQARNISAMNGDVIRMGSTGKRMEIVPHG